MNPSTIRAKFGDDYAADERTVRLGIDIRITERIASRFAGRRVLETCTGAGFTTISLARVAKHVVTIEVDPQHQAQARMNLEKTCLLDRVTLIAGDALSSAVLNRVGQVDSAFLDPDWAVTGPDHVFRFRQSNTRPPADALLAHALALTKNVAPILPPDADLRELEGLPPAELQSIYLDGSHALMCVYFGSLAERVGSTQMCV